jgi:hypothetical protein
MSKAKKDATTKKGGAKAKAAKGAKKPAPGAAAPPAVDLEPLRKPVEEAKAALAVAEAEAHEMTEKARTLVAGARDTYREALAPYRDACRKAKAPCEYEGGRGTNLSEKVSFQVEKVEKGVRVTVKGKPDTEEVIPMAALKESVNKAAYAYTDKHVGPRERVGNKGGSLSNRLRAAIR